jgi:hypothetical protein
MDWLSPVQPMVQTNQPLTNVLAFEIYGNAVTKDVKKDGNVVYELVNGEHKAMRSTFVYVNFKKCLDALAVYKEIQAGTMQKGVVLAAYGGGDNFKTVLQAAVQAEQAQQAQQPETTI